MAARKSGSDSYNNGPVSYLEDVPFKLSEKFRVPAKVGLPVGFCLPDSALLHGAQYDFSLERRSVQWGLDLEEARVAQERLSCGGGGASETETSPPHLPPSSSSSGSASSSSCPSPPAPLAPPPQNPPLPPAINPVLAALSHNAILTPLPSPAPSLAPPPDADSAPPTLDLADFEREEDPFDKLELKTIDDKEELRSILQSSCQPEGGVATAGGVVTTPGVVTSAVGAGSRGNSPSHKRNNGLVAVLDDRPCNIRSLSFPKLSDSEQLTLPPRTNATPPLRQATPPATRLPNGSPQRTQRGEVIRAPELSKSRPVNSCGPAECPGGGAVLSAAERQCVETLVGMGYSYEGVMRAMQRQGQNVEQVLDYLFVHSRLCERGFDASAVEECLEMYQCSEEKALQFLQLSSRFGEMGFERDVIKEVLLFHNNDQDKALEELMSRSSS